MNFSVQSEVGQLRQVIVHRPGLELSRLTPGNVGELLFDDVLWAGRAREEHDAFAEALRGRGVRVHYFGQLLAETLEVPTGRPVALDVAWVVLPELTIQVARQEYTLLERGADGAQWRFRGLDSEFVAELAVDHHGLVLDYPGIARRVI